jgi:hypothetical protein
MRSRIAIKTNENLVLQDQVTRLAREIERVRSFKLLKYNCLRKSPEKKSNFSERLLMLII